MRYAHDDESFSVALYDTQNKSIPLFDHFFSGASESGPGPLPPDSWVTFI